MKTAGARPRVTRSVAGDLKRRHGGLEGSRRMGRTHIRTYMVEHGFLLVSYFCPVVWAWFVLTHVCPCGVESWPCPSHVWCVSRLGADFLGSNSVWDRTCWVAACVVCRATLANASRRVAGRSRPRLAGISRPCRLPACIGRGRVSWFLAGVWCVAWPSASGVPQASGVVAIPILCSPS